MAENITFVLQPETDFASLGAVAKSLEDIHKLLRHVDYSATRHKGGRLWRVEKISSTDPTLTLVPPPGETDSIEVIATGLNQVTESSTTSPPSHFSEDALKHLSKMSRLFKGRNRLSRVSVFVSNSDFERKHIATIRNDIHTKVARILRSGYSELGSLEGTLEVINLHGSPTFTIWEQISGMPVRCTFPNDQSWKRRVRDLLEQPVLIEGQVNYFGNGLPRSISSIRDVIEVTPDPNLPRADYGSIPDMTGETDTIEYLRTVRGG